MGDAGSHLSQRSQAFRPTEFFPHVFKSRDVDIEPLIKRIASMPIFDRDCAAQDLMGGPIGMNKAKDIFKRNLLSGSIREGTVDVGSVIRVNGLPDAFRI